MQFVYTVQICSYIYSLHIYKDEGPIFINIYIYKYMFNLLWYYDKKVI